LPFLPQKNSFPNEQRLIAVLTVKYVNVLLILLTRRFINFTKNTYILIEYLIWIKTDSNPRNFGRD